MDRMFNMQIGNSIGAYQIVVEKSYRGKTLEYLGSDGSICHIFLSVTVDGILVGELI
jgi:hypothetical protein